MDFPHPTPSGKPHLSYERFRTAASALSAEGIIVDVGSVCDYLCYAGDRSQLTPWLRRWQAELRAVPDRALSEQAPPAVAQALETLWQSAKEAAGAGFAALRQQADAEIADATAHRVEALASLKRERQHSEELQHHLERQLRRATELENALAVERERCTQLDAARHAADSARAKWHDAYERAREQARTQIESDRVEAAAEQRERLAELTELRTLYGRSERQGEIREQQLQTLRQQHRQLHEQLAELRVSLKERESQNRALKLEHEQLAHRSGHMQHQIGRLSAERDSGRARVSRLQAELKTALQESAERESRLQQLSQILPQALQDDVAATVQTDADPRPPRLDDDDSGSLSR